MSKIRLLRVLEYEYQDDEAMIADVATWSAPQNGIKQASSKVMIRSACLPISFISDATEVKESRSE